LVVWVAPGPQSNCLEKRLEIDPKPDKVCAMWQDCTVTYIDLIGTTSIAGMRDKAAYVVDSTECQLGASIELRNWARPRAPRSTHARVTGGAHCVLAPPRRAARGENAPA
jgi:hypothetical protein